MDNKKKMGRPTTSPRVNQLRIRLSDEELLMLEKCCNETGMNKTEVVVKGIEIIYSEITK